MNKEISIEVFDEIGDDTIISGTGLLDLSTGAVKNVEYEIPQAIPPSKKPNYSFSYGLLKLNGKELEFTLEPQKNGEYKVPTNEFTEMKEKAVQLLNKATKIKP
jgi:hypothetical protein